MAKVLIIGAGGVGRVVAHKCAQVASVFTEIVLASRTRPIKKFCQGFLQSKKVVKAVGRGGAIKLDQKIEIAGFVHFTGGSRAEDIQSANMVLPAQLF